MGAALWSWFLVGSEGNVIGTSSSSTSAAAAAAAAAAGPAAKLALFLPESRRDVKPRENILLEVVPSFSSMVFRCGEGCVSEACSISSSSTTSSSSRSRSSSSRPSSCNRFVLDRIQKDPEGTSSLGTACFWRSFRPSGPWCFAVSQPPARTLLWSCFEGMGAALWSWFLVGSEGNVRHWSLLAGRRFRLSVPWCFAVSQPPARTSLWSR